MAHFHPLDFNIILFGIKGHGKSASGNTLLRRKAFISNESLQAGTQEVQMASVSFDGVTLNVYDTPGIFSQESNEIPIPLYQSLFQLDMSARTVILLVIKAERIASEEVRLIVELLPEFLVQNTWILFTKGDGLKQNDLTIEQFIEETEELKEVLQRFQNRYHVFNNFSQNPDQVRELISKIKEAPEIIPPEMGFPQTTPANPEQDSLHRRILLMGKTGAGKSATGNTILGECELHQTVVSDRNISVIDSPGLFDTNISREKLSMEIGRSIYLSSPGPHAFLYVRPINSRFTEEEENVFPRLELIFGRGMKKYTIILFTHGDMLEEKSVDELIQENRSLSKLVDECGGRYHIFNNKQLGNKEQVSELLEKIDRMVEENGGTCYSNHLYEEALRFRQEEETRMREEQERHRREQEETRMREVEERLRKELEEARIREEQERHRREEEIRTRGVEERHRRGEVQVGRSTEHCMRNDGFEEFHRGRKEFFHIASDVVNSSAKLGVVIGLIIIGGVAFILTKGTWCPPLIQSMLLVLKYKR